MADAANVMAALDAQAADSDSLAAYARAREISTEVVLESDPVASTIIQFMSQPENLAAGWVGTATDLYKAIMVHGGVYLPDSNWPANPRGLSERLTKIATPLSNSRGLVLSRKRGNQRMLSLSKGCSHDPLVSSDFSPHLHMQ